MGARGAGLAAGARALIVTAVLVALAVSAPALLRPARTDWATLILLIALYALAEAVPRCEALGRRVPRTAAAYGGESGPPPEVCGPLLLTAVFLLPPEAAALVPVAGACIGRVPARHAVARRIWRAARLALAAYAAAFAPQLLLGGLLPAPGPGDPLVAVGLPGALIPAAVAVPVYCLTLTLLDGAVLIAAERCAPRAAWRGRCAPMLPPYCVHALAGLLMAVLWRSPYGPVAALFVLLPMSLCCWVFAEYQRERAAHQSTVRALVQAVDLKDRYTRGHSERVGRASAMIARELGMDDDRTETLRFAGILHDVGKLGVPTRLLRKAGPLSPLERSVLELHPEYGHEMVRGIRFLGEARSAILHHHERLDGTGYPYGLSGSQIPEPARLVAVADAFDAMTSNRSYSRARPVHEAVAELDRCAGTHFDARMVGALSRALDHHGWSPAVTADPSGDGARADAPAAGFSPVERADLRPAGSTGPAGYETGHRAVPAARSRRRHAGPGRHRSGSRPAGAAPTAGHPEADDRRRGGGSRQTPGTADEQANRETGQDRVSTASSPERPAVPAEDPRTPSRGGDPRQPWPFRRPGDAAGSAGHAAPGDAGRPSPKTPVSPEEAAAREAASFRRHGTAPRGGA